MKSTIQILFFLLFSFTTAKMTAQAFDCNQFCVTDIRMDTVLEDYMIVTIFFDGDSTDFINYPHVAVVLDLQGDTVGTSQLDLFGQIGNTSAEYHVQTELDSIPENFNAYIYFNFDTSTCVLPYPCTTSAVIPTTDFAEFNVYPNPFSTETVIQFDEYYEDLTLEVFNLQGQRVMKFENVAGEQFTIAGTDLRTGIYVVLIAKDKNVIAREKICVE